MKLNIKLLFVLMILAYASCDTKKAESNEDSIDSTEDMAVQEEADQSETMEGNMAKAVINSASGSELTGMATFTDNGDGTVKFELKVENAVAGEHAVHLHQKGDCSAEDATSAGGHWNPSEEAHGKRGETAEFHAGDIANLNVGDDGTGNMTMNVKGWSVGSGDDSDVIGRGIIIHAKADDFESQPSGAAGSRVGCGVIELQ